ncbi:uncharacterized protein SETTUDRAFT_167282, partial [Exserohilum turcica Et28A]
MDSFPSTFSDQNIRSNESLPLNIRGEDEVEWRYLSELIEAQAWILYPLKPVSCIVGRHPPPRKSHSTSISISTSISASTSAPPSSQHKHTHNKQQQQQQQAYNPSNAFCASLYTITKGGLCTLQLGPEVGTSRKDVLGKLLYTVEMEVGRL